MHSSRMRTGRSLTVCRRLLPGGGGVSAQGVCSQGVSASGGCLLLGGLVSAPGGVSAPRRVSALVGYLLLGGVCSRECLLLRGVCSGGGVCS